MSDIEKIHPSNDDAQELNEEQLEAVSGGDNLRAETPDHADCKPIPESPDTMFGLGL